MGREAAFNIFALVVGAVLPEGLVKQENPDVAGQGASNSYYLLLAAGEIIRRTVEPFTNPREILVDAPARPVRAVAVSDACHSLRCNSFTVVGTALSAVLDSP
jgi:hypothetical protein